MARSPYLHSYLFSNLVLLNSNNFNLNDNEVDYIYFEMFLLPASKQYLKYYYFDTASISDTKRLSGKILLNIESLINTYKLIAIFNSYTSDQISRLFTEDKIVSKYINIEGVFRELDLNYEYVIQEYFLSNEMDYIEKNNIVNYLKEINKVLISNNIKNQLAYN